MSKKIMTPEEFKEKMREISNLNSPNDHIEADILMCELLTDLGYGEGIKIFDEEVNAWYE